MVFEQSRPRLFYYLNDHLAGSVAAFELVDRLIETYKGKPLEQFFKDPRTEIDAINASYRTEWAYSMPSKGWFSESPVSEVFGPR